MTQAQLLFLGYVISSGGHTDCKSIGEYRAREAFHRKGYLERDRVTANRIILFRITEKARREMRKMANSELLKEIAG